MGYRCPICETLQADREHLAHHVAFMAILHGGDHETWLAERVPNWADRGPAELADAVAEDVPEVDEEVVSSILSKSSPAAIAPTDQSTGELNDPTVRAALQEARRLTRRRRDDLS